MRFLLLVFTTFFLLNLGHSQTEITKAHISLTSENGLYNETIVAFLPDATVGVDNQYDVIKLIANPNIALYTFIENEKYAIQALPTIENEVTVQLGLICLPNINQQLKLIVFDYFESGQVMLLRDLELDSTVVMNLDSTYNFTTTSMDVNERFQLIFLPSIKVEVTPETCVGNNGTLHFTNPSQYPGTLHVINTTFNSPEFTIENFLGDTTFTQLIYGEYQISFEDSFGRNQNTSVEIAYGYAIQANISASHDTVELGDSTFQLFATTNLDVFTEWDFGDNTPYSNETNPFHTYLEPGNFMVKYRGTNTFCTVFDSLLVVVIQKPDTLPVDTLPTDTLSIYPMQQSPILIYPNPANEWLNIDGLEENEPAFLQVYALDGRIVLSKMIQNHEFIDLKNWLAGTYIFDIKSKQKKPHQQLIIKSP